MKHRRILGADAARLRVESDGAKVAGYASVWGVRDRHNTVFAPGAFGPEDVIPLVWNHNGEAIPVGQVRVFDDEYGRAFEGELFTAELGEARALARLLSSKAVRDCSHGFIERAAPDRTGTYAADSVRMVEVSAALPYTGSNPSAHIEARTNLDRAAGAIGAIAQIREQLDNLQGLFDGGGTYGTQASAELEEAVAGELEALRKYLKGITLKSA